MLSHLRRNAIFTFSGSLAHLDTVLVAQPSPAASSSSVSLRGRIARLDSRGETPPEPAGEDARATILPGDAKNGVKMRLGSLLRHTAQSVFGAQAQLDISMCIRFLIRQ
jgi:hypothetical protein